MRTEWKPNRFVKFDNLIKNTKTLTAEEMKKHSNELYDKKVAEDAKLLAAFEAKKLKSKTAIKRAIQLKKEQDKKKD